MGARLRLIELTAAMSLATDAGTGQPFEHALRTCLLAVRAGDALALTPAQRSAVMYTTLLRFLGCTSDASQTAVLAGGDEIAFNAAMAPVVMADDRAALPHLLRHLGEDLPLHRRVGRIAAALSDPGGKARSLASHCEVGARLATRMRLPVEVVHGVGHAYERWDGKGLPAGLAGDDIPLATRIAVVARDVDLTHASSGSDELHRVLEQRRGHAYDPAVVDAFLAGSETWLDEIDGLDPWDAVLDAEPAPVAEVDDEQLDVVLTAFADFADLKSPWFTGHSRAVAELAAAAAAASGLDAVDVAVARRAGLVHDLGIVGVPAGVWNRAGPLTREGWERVRTHAYVGERILSWCGPLAEIASVAGAHHERADGSGYHRGVRDLSLIAQIVAAADIYRAVCEDRPHRAALEPETAAKVLADEADVGRLHRSATDAVLAAAGHAPAIPNVTRPAGLTEREVDVLRLIARGRSNKQVAHELGISAKTVGTHVEHIYAKAGVTTRAGATLFAMEHDLIRA
ncbi:MAG TPA: HD domain-containing phosphohydrolase [Acidimicrobiales bacterium]|nr:HD domain-containing phosphohydrolase [Acidimicrobiales bacterium]